MPIYKSIAELIGKTPIFELVNYQRIHALKACIFAKAEYFNPFGSIKDRTVKSMLDAAEKHGYLKKGATVIEPTSGNTGIALAALGNLYGYKVIIVMPDNMSEERKKLISAYGAELVLTDGRKGMKGAVAEAENLKNQIGGALILGQFDNPANPAVHFNETAVELWEDLRGEIDIFVSGVGSGGTITGVGEFLKSKNPCIRVVAAEPLGSPLLSEGRSGTHAIQGLGAGFIPAVLNTNIYDEVIAVSDEDAFVCAREIAVTDGIFAGVSSGAVLCAAQNLARRRENYGKNIAVIFPDGGEKYMSEL